MHLGGLVTEGEQCTKDKKTLDWPAMSGSLSKMWNTSMDENKISASICNSSIDAPECW